VISKNVCLYTAGLRVNQAGERLQLGLVLVLCVGWGGGEELVLDGRWIFLNQCKHHHFHYFFISPCFRTKATIQRFVQRL
jgi:hypothetical protein